MTPKANTRVGGEGVWAVGVATGRVRSFALSLTAGGAPSSPSWKREREGENTCYWQHLYTNTRLDLILEQHLGRRLVSVH